MPPLAHYSRLVRTLLAPIPRLAGKVRRRLVEGQSGSLSVWLLKAAMRHASRRRIRGRGRIDPDAWRMAWRDGGAVKWPTQPVSGVIESAGIKLVIDRCEITGAGHLWLDGWAIKPEAVSLQLEAWHCTIAWQATFAAPRPDVVQKLQLSLVGRDANLGMQVLARVADYVPGRSRLALTARQSGSEPTLVVPIVARVERSGSMWRSVYDAMRHRGQRDAAYLEASVLMLKELRKIDWRERSAAISQTIDEAMPNGARLKILVLSRLHPGVAYLNLILLAEARAEPADFIVCSMGQTAIQRANEYRTGFATIGAHDVGFVSAENGTPSSELIEQFALSCRRRGCPCLVIYDDVAVAPAMGSLRQVLRLPTTKPVAWQRRYPQTGPTELVYAVPLAANDGPGPYWRSARAMAHGGIGALLFDPAQSDIPALPPFEGRGYGLEYLLECAPSGTGLAEAAQAGETMLDLLDPATQREAHGLDMLMLLASAKG